MLLEDLKKQEQVCIDKYTKYSAEACDEQLKNLFSQLGQKETEHLQTIHLILNGTVPPLPQNSPVTPEQYTPSACENKKMTNIFVPMRLPPKSMFQGNTTQLYLNFQLRTSEICSITFKKKNNNTDIKYTIIWRKTVCITHSKK